VALNVTQPRRKAKLQPRAVVNGPGFCTLPLPLPGCVIASRAISRRRERVKGWSRTERRRAGRMVPHSHAARADSLRLPRVQSLIAPVLIVTKNANRLSTALPLRVHIERQAFHSALVVS